jgi:hypothetical protein
MVTLKLKTNLRCEACVQSIRSLMDAEKEIVQWSADLSVPDKVLTVEGHGVSVATIDGILQQKGYRVLGEIAITSSSMPSKSESQQASYYPLFLILLYILGVVGLSEIALGDFDWMRFMRHFMAGFFIVFSFFKLLNVSAFADSYSAYDIVARQWRTYGYVYPFIELGLGIAYTLDFVPFLTNVVTLIVMGVSTIGVVQSLLARRKIQCACLGTVFNLPMSFITIIEDVLMVVMALAMLLFTTATNH